MLAERLSRDIQRKTWHQDPLQLDWWPRDLNDKPLKNIYRAVRADFEEWLDDDPDHDARNCKTKAEMLWHVVDAILRGSKQRSPFVHFSHTENGARCYWKPGGVIVSIDLVEMYSAGALQTPSSTFPPIKGGRPSWNMIRPSGVRRWRIV